MTDETKRSFVIHLPEEIVEHLQSEQCEANKFLPCGFSETVMALVHESVRKPTEAQGEG